MINHVQFPGLGLEFTINRVAFTVAGLDIYWYGIILATGLLMGLLFAFHYAPDFGIDSDRFVDVVFIGTFMAIVCARAYYVAFVPYTYESVWAMLDIRDGGIAMYGSLIGAFLFGGLACKWRKIPVRATFDAVSVGFLIGQGIGRWGNFVNQEAFGTNTDLPWGMISEGTRNYLTWNHALLASEGVTVDPNMPVHPTFLYESITCFIGLALVWALMRRRKYDGELFIWYLIWNGANRFWIERLRTDSLMFSVELNLRTSQVIALTMVGVGLAIDITMRRRSAGKQLMVPLAITSANLKKLHTSDGPVAIIKALPATASHAEFVKETNELNRWLSELDVKQYLQEMKENIPEEEIENGSTED